MVESVHLEDVVDFVNSVDFIERLRRLILVDFDDFVNSVDFVGFVNSVDLVEIV